MTKRRDFSSTFREGRYFDLWMVVHLLCGVTGGFSNVFFGLSERDVYLVGFALMVAWEIGEYIAGIRESMENRALDIGVGLVGVFIALRIAERLDPTAEIIAFVLSAMIFAGGCVIGWRAHRHRASSPPT